MDGFRLRVVLAIAIAVAATSAHAQRSASEDPRLDGSSAAKLEASAAVLRNALSASRREDFDVALAMIWIQRTANEGDVDGDEDLDLDDIRLLEDDASDLLTQIRRGNLVYAIETRATRTTEFKAADYFALLDGLRYDDVVDLAGHTRAEDYLEAAGHTRVEAARRTRTQSTCLVDSSRPSGSRAQQRAANECVNSTARILRAGGLALNSAITALGEQRYADARAALRDLASFRTPYERSKAEQILFHISYTEGNHAEAREHLLRALEAGGLNAQETADALQRIRFIESGLSATPQ